MQLDGPLSIRPYDDYNPNFVLFGGLPIDRNYSAANFKLWGSKVLTDAEMFEQLGSPSMSFVYTIENALVVHQEWNFNDSLVSEDGLASIELYEGNGFSFKYDPYLNKTVLVSNMVIRFLMTFLKKQEFISNVYELAL